MRLWNVRTPGAFLEHFGFARHHFNISLSLMLVSFASLAEVVNQMRGLYAIYKSRDMSEWQGFMNCIRTERRFITIIEPASFAYFLGTLLRTISTISLLIYFSMHIPDNIRYISVSNGRVAQVMGYNTTYG